MLSCIQRWKKSFSYVMILVMAATLLLPQGLIQEVSAEQTDVILVKWTGAGSFVDSSPTMPAHDSSLDMNRSRGITIGGATVTAFESAGPTAGSKVVNTRDWSVGGYWKASFDTTGYDDIKVSSRQYSSGTGPRNFQFQYSLDDNNWVALTYIAVGNATWENSGAMLAIALPSEAANQPNVYVRWQLLDNESARNGTGSYTNDKLQNGGTSRIADIVVTGMPHDGNPPAAKTAAPNGSKVTLTDNGELTGEAGAVASSAFVAVYDKNDTIIDSDQAAEDGSFHMMLSALESAEQVFVTAKENDKGESGKTTISMLKTSAPDIAKILFRNEVVIEGAAGAVAGQATIDASYDDATAAGNIAAAADGSFHLTIENPDRKEKVYLTAKQTGRLASDKIAVSLRGEEKQIKPGDVVFSQVYLAGGNSGAVYTTKFFELYNATEEDINLDGWSIQYAARTGNFGTGNSAYKALSGTIKAHGYYLITGSTSTNGVPLSIQADMLSSLNPSQSAGKLALSRQSASLSGKNDPNAIDFIAWADAPNNLPNDYWGSPIVAPQDGEGHTGVEAFKKGTLLRRTNDGADPRGAVGSGNGWFTRNPAVDLLIHFAESPAEPDSSLIIRNSQTAAAPKMITNAPLSANIVFENDEGETAEAAVNGAAGAVDPNAEVNIYTASERTLTLVRSAQAGNDGSFEVTFPARSALKTVYAAARSGAREESRLVRIDEPGYDPSSELLTIADLRLNNKAGMPINIDAVLRISGVATNGTVEFGNGDFYMQDETGGIKIAGGIIAGSEVVRGEELTVTGKVQFNKGMTYIVPQAIIKEGFSSDPPVPLELTVEEMNNYAVAEATEGKLAANSDTRRSIGILPRSLFRSTASNRWHGRFANRS
ncbi:lamin tail domain-containing protein [Paenibacillaceae bacterium]|nr:lamin tail domain-containing protein [Paenibacillaceae bacterium]